MQQKVGETGPMCLRPIMRVAVFTNKKRRKKGSRLVKNQRISRIAGRGGQMGHGPGVYIYHGVSDLGGIGPRGPIDKNPPEAPKIGL